MPSSGQSALLQNLRIAHLRTPVTSLLEINAGCVIAGAPISVQDTQYRVQTTI
jgi:hypothetical protein